MKEAHPELVRNIALVAHQGAGKTTLTESLLHRMGVITRMGSIQEGNTVSDYHSDEIARQISISTTLLTGSHKGVKINILDTPGFTDFIGEVQSALRVSDCAAVLVNGVSGLEVGTELVWGIAEDLNLPRFLYVNLLDRENADFDGILTALRGRFGAVMALNFPVNPGNEGFNQVVDVLNMKITVWNADGGENSRADIPAQRAEQASELRSDLIEAVAESDDALMEKFFEQQETLGQEDLTAGLRKGFREGKLFPVLCGASKAEVGTSLLLDFLTDLAPSPADMPPVEAAKESGEVKIPVKCDVHAPTTALIFKTVSDKHVGDLSFFRVYSGALETGVELQNSKRGRSEKIGQIFTVSGRIRKNVDSVPAGDMGALVKLKDTHTGDSLVSPRENITLPEIVVPEPVARIAIIPRNKGDEEKISNALHILAEEDPSINFKYDPELQQLILSGQGELHLTIIIERLKERFNVEVDQTEPRIPYRETIRGSAEGQGKYKKQTGGRGQYGDCWLRLEPLPRSGGVEFVDAIVGGVIPGKFIPAVEKGVLGAIEDGVIAGYRVVDLKVACFDGSYHTVDSSENAFKVAASIGFKKVFREAKPIILEPIHNLEVRVPEAYMGDIMGDISSKRGKIMGIDREGSFQVIRAKVPLAELFRYSSALRSMTGGRGIYKLTPSHYEDVPPDIQANLVAAYEEKRAEGGL